MFPQLPRVKWRLLPWSHGDLLLKGLPFWGTKRLYHFYPVAVSWGVSASHAQVIFIVVSVVLYVNLFKVNQSINQAFVPSLLCVSCLPGPRYRRQTRFLPRRVLGLENFSPYLLHLSLLPSPPRLHASFLVKGCPCLGLVSISESDLVPPHPGEVSVYESLASRSTRGQR